jgi:hypothetical protein
MAEMDIGFGPGKFNPDLNTQMGGVDPLLQKASRIKSPEEGIGVAVELAGEERRLQERETAAKIAKEKALPEIEAAFRAEEGRLVKEARTREQDVMAEAEQAMSKFTVSKETLGGMATLASVIGVLGSLAGNTGGRQAGLGAIKSMTGMMSGYQKGRADEFRRDQIEFDKQYKIMQGKLDRASKEFDRAIAMMPYNMAEAQKIKSIALAELKSDIISAVDAKQGITRANTILKQAVDIASKNADRANQLNIAQAKSKGVGILKPSAKAGEGYISLNILSNDLKGLTKDLQNPALQQQIRDNRVEAFLTEEAKFLDQLLATDLPPELNVFLTKVRDIRNNYYLDLSGKAVTGGEALRNYGTVPQPGDSPERMQQKVSGMVDRVDSKIRSNQVLYGFPAVALDQFPAGTKTSLVPGQNYMTQENPVQVDGFEFPSQEAADKYMAAKTSKQAK